MSKTLGKLSFSAILALVLVTGCNSQQEQQLPQSPALPQAQTQLPAAAPAASGVPQAASPVAAAAPAVQTPPATPLIPVGDIDNTPAPSVSTGKKVGSGGIDKKLPGPATSGDELVGGYTCQINSKKLQIGPIKLPSFGCRIYKASDGSLKVGSTSQGAGSLKGNVQDQTAVGFFIAGKYEMGGNSLSIKAKMKLSGATKYVGNGRGRLNNDKSTQIKYTLTMTRN